MANETLTFEKFLEFLPQGGIPKATALSEGVEYVTEENPSFVSPTVTVVSFPTLGSIALVLVVAPAALGKSTLARHIAFRKQALLWDLSRFQVGTNTIAGTLVDVFGSQTGEVMSRMKDGDFLIILDALDEAQMRSGQINFEAFLSEIAKRTENTKNRPSIVLLARSETAEWISMWVEMHSVPTATFKLNFFEEPSAREFVVKQLDRKYKSKNKQPGHRQQAAPFNDALSSFFRFVCEVLRTGGDNPWKDPRISSFLGYAPVLETVAEYLFDQNFLKLTHTLEELKSRVAGGNDQWKFFLEIVYAILDREQVKVVGAVQPAMEQKARAAGWTDWKSLYKRDEQCWRVVSKYLGGTKMHLGPALPASMVSDYEAATTLNMAQHPFLGEKGDFANAVFREFAFAWALAKGDRELRSQLRSRLRHDRYRPTTVLGRVFLILTGGGDIPTIMGEDVGLLYDSLGSQAYRTSDVYLEIWSTREGHYCVMTLGVEDREDVLVSVDVQTKDLDIWWRLGPCDIDVKESVRLGQAGVVFFLGPDSRVQCTRLTTAFQELEVDASNTGVSLVAQEYGSDHPTPRIKIVGSPRGFTVNWAEVAYPWVSYYAKAPDVSLFGASERTWSVVRKFILMFRRQRTRLVSTVIKSRWATEEQQMRDRLLGIAEKRGVIRKDGDKYVFNSAFDSLKTYFQVDFKPSDKVVAFLRDAISDIQG